MLILRWPSWLITAPNKSIKSKSNEIRGFLAGVTKGIDHFNSNKEEAIEYIGTHLAYTKDDAREWIKSVEFVKDAAKVDNNMVQSTVDTLVHAGVMKEQVSVAEMIESLE